MSEWVRSSHPGPPAAYQWTTLFILEGNTRGGGGERQLVRMSLANSQCCSQMLQWKICQCLYCDWVFQALRIITKLWMASSVLVFKTIPLFGSICHFWNPESFQMKAGRYRKWNNATTKWSSLVHIYILDFSRLSGLPCGNLNVWGNSSDICSFCKWVDISVPRDVFSSGVWVPKS